MPLFTEPSLSYRRTSVAYDGISESSHCSEREPGQQLRPVLTDSVSECDFQTDLLRS